MNYWVRNEFDIGNDPTPGIRPYWLTDYALSDGVTGPRSIVAKLSGPTGTASGILIAPNVVLTANHVVGTGAGSQWTAYVAGNLRSGLDDETIRPYFFPNQDELTNDLALLKISNTGLAANDLFGLMVFADEIGDAAAIALNEPIVSAGHPGNIYDDPFAAMIADQSHSMDGPQYEMEIVFELAQVP
jgi:hypothetical protein